MSKEIVLPVSELKEALPGLNKLVSKGRSLPVLQSVRVARNSDGIVTLQSTDLDSFATYKARTAQQGEATEVLVPADQLNKALKCSAPKESIGVVALASPDKVTLRYKIAGSLVEQTVATAPVTDWPTAPRVSRPGIQLEAKFGRALKEALECCSGDSSRKVITGACLDVQDPNLHYVVGTDGRSLFSANSFSFALEKSIIIPDSKFLTWSDFLEMEPCSLSVEPGVAAQKEGGKNEPPPPAWIKLESPRWTFITKEIDGNFPNWKQCVPRPGEKRTRIDLSEEGAKQLLQVIPNIPGKGLANHPVRLRADAGLFVVEGRNSSEESWTSIPIEVTKVEGDPVMVAVNRDYLSRAVRFGLTSIEVQDALSPVIFSKGGKRLVVMPIRLEDAAPGPREMQESSPEPVQESTPVPSKEPEVTAQKVETPAPVQQQQQARETGVKPLLAHIDQIKDSLKEVIRNLNEVADGLKLAEKEKRATEKEIDIIRAKLRQIQSVSI